MSSVQAAPTTANDRNLAKVREMLQDTIGGETGQADHVTAAKRVACVSLAYGAKVCPLLLMCALQVVLASYCKSQPSDHLE